MKKSKKFLVALAFFGLSAGMTSAQTSGSCGDNLTWELTGSGSNLTLTINGAGAMHDFTSTAPWYSSGSNIKTLVINSGVTTIGNYAFSNCSGLTGITIPNSVISIGQNAFQDCSGLTNITIEDGTSDLNITVSGSVIQKIFGGCPINTVYVGRNITYSGSYGLFEGKTTMTSVTIGNSVTTLPTYLFAGCGLTEVTIPSSVTSIGGSAFSGGSLTAINVDANNQYYCSQDGILYNKLQNTFIQVPAKITGAIIIPNNITSIPGSTFSSRNLLTSVTIGNSVTSIGTQAFQGCTGLTSVTNLNPMPPTISSNTFSNVNNVTLNVPCLSLYQLASYWQNFGIITGSNGDCPTLSWEIGNPNAEDVIAALNFADSTLTISGTGAMKDFSSTNQPYYNYRNVIKNVIIQDSVTTIGKYAFYNCRNLTSVTNFNPIPPKISSYEFSNVNLSNATLNVPCVYLYQLANIWKNFGTITGSNDECPPSPLSWNIGYPNTVDVVATLNIADSTLTISGTGAMQDYPSEYPPYENYSSFIKNVIIQDGVTTIGSYAFYNYSSSLKTVTIGNSVTSIGSRAFLYCSGLTTVTNLNPVPQTINSDVFQSVSLSLVTLNVTCVYVYQSASIWRNFRTIIGSNNQCPPLSWEIGYPNVADVVATLNFVDSTLIISGTGAMQNYEYYKPYNDFSNDIKNIIIQDGVTSIGSYAFSSCSGLTSVTNLNSTPQPIYGAFSGIDLSNATLNVPCVSIYQNSHEWNYFGTITSSNDDCPTLSWKIGYPNTEDVVASLNFADSTLTINGMGAMKDFSSSNQPYYNYRSVIRNVIIEDSVTTIGNYAFQNCSGLTEVTIPDYVTSIGSYAFSGCSSLTDTLTIPNSVISIGNYAFSGCNGLKSIIAEPITPPQLTGNPFNGISANAAFYIPCLTYNDYKNAWGNKNYIVNGAVSDTTRYNGVLCYNSSFSDENFTQPIYQAGKYYVIYPNANNCDSVVCLNLIQNPYIPITTYSAQMCRNSSFSDDNFVNLTQTGYHYDTLQSVTGCDSVVRLYLSYYPDVPITTYYKTICQGSSFSDDNFTNITQAGYHYDTLKNVTNCDSVVRLYLTVTAPPVSYYYAQICNGESYTDNHFSNLTQAASYRDTVKTANGCDSIVQLNLSYKVSPVQNICMVSVDNTHNQIVWNRAEKVASYNIYREGAQSEQYDFVANVPYISLNIYTDMASNANVRSYRYKVSAIDTCGNESAQSASHRTMHLTINQGQNNSWNLIWTAYEGADYSTYNIYRATGNGQNFALIGTMPGGNTSFTDFSASNGNIYYMVEIILDNTCQVYKPSFAPSPAKAPAEEPLIGSIRSNIATNAPDETGINETEFGNMTIYPNPVKNQLRITNYELREGNFTIFNIAGQIVGSGLKPDHKPDHNGETTIDVSHLPSGIYFIKAGNMVGKFIKE